MGGTDNTGIDELGPVDYLVVEFPADRANFFFLQHAQKFGLRIDGHFR